MLGYIEIWQVDDLFILWNAYKAYFRYKETLDTLSDLWLDQDSAKITELFEQKKQQFIKKLITDMADMAALHIHNKSPMFSKDAPISVWEWHTNIEKLIYDLQKIWWDLDAVEMFRIRKLRTALNQIETCGRISGLTWTITFGDPTIAKMQALQNRIQQECFSEILDPIRENTKLPNRKMIDYAD